MKLLYLVFCIHFRLYSASYYDFEEHSADTHSEFMRHVDDWLNDTEKKKRAPFSEYVERQAKVWNIIDSMDSYKNRNIYSQGDSDGRPTLSNFHYLVQPVWWSDENQTNSSLLMDLDIIDVAMAKAVEYYSDMSWGKMQISYDVLHQQKLDVSSVNPNLISSRKSCERLLLSQGYKKGENYDGVVLIHHLAKSGIFSNNGGLGLINFGFTWVSWMEQKLDQYYKIFRHEIGHNLGHDHHGRNDYYLRETRPHLSGVTDGFNLMAGGNGYEVSDFNVAPKWFYNWVDDESIVKMQPEGSTTECPDCVSSGTFVIKPADMRGGEPTRSEILGIHIPITSIVDDRYDTDYLYSYWISYRSGVNGDASDGVSIHLAWFELYGLVGCYYDSLLYDTYAHTESKFDSFLGKDSCYHVSPSIYMKDRDFTSAQAVQPIVCVDDINPGSNVTVSVSFLNTNTPPLAQVDLVEQPKIDCSSSQEVQKSVDASRYNLFHISYSGSDGLIAVSLGASEQAQESTAYIYDSYPHSPISLKSDPAFGSFAFLTSESPVLSYKSDLDNTWILLPPSNNLSGTTSSISLTCVPEKCIGNHYLAESGTCKQCPSNSLSDYGSISITNCKKCPDGTGITDPRATKCSLSETYKKILQAKGWRVWAPNFHSSSGWGWAVKNLSFFSDLECQSFITPTGTPINSANAGFSFQPENAFDLSESTTWGGRVDSNEIFWLGMMFDSLKTVQCIKILSGNNHVFELRVQAYNDEEGAWENAWIQDSVTSGENIIKLAYSAEASPTTKPTVSPTTSPTSPQISKCEELGSTLYLFKYNNKGRPVKRTCTSLSIRPEAIIKNICQNNKDTHWKYDPAAVACPVTCGCKENISPVGGAPTATPVKQPIASPAVPPTNPPTNLECQESGSTQYLFKIRNNGKPVTKTCGSLSQKLPTERENICKADVGFHVRFEPARIACPVSCGCRSGNMSCNQNDNDEFLLRKRYANGKAIAVKQTCSWLDSRPDERKSTICQNMKSFDGILPANAVCFISCNSPC